MSGDGQPTVKFWQSGTFWSLVIAAIGQIVQAAVAPDGALRFVTDQALAPDPGLATGGDVMTWAGILLAAWRRAVARGQWTF